LVGSTTAADVFVVNSSSDVVTVGASGTNDTIEASANYTLPTNVQYLTLTGTSAWSATGNSALDLIVGNSGADTLTGGSGIAALEGGRTAGSDQIKASSNQAALIAGAGSSTLTGGAYKDFYAAGLVSDSITTGATANVVSVNKGDGATTLAPTTSASNVLSLGAGIDTESLEFTKSGNNLVLTDGVSGDSITFTSWFSGSSDQDYSTLQVIEIASPNYNSGGSDPLRNKPIEAFNFKTLVSAYIAAGESSNWLLSNDMASAALTTSASADYGGDLAYYFGLNGNLTGVDLTDVSSVLTNSAYGTGTQTINAFSSISGGGGLHVLVKGPGATPPLSSPGPVPSTVASGSTSSTDPVSAASTPAVAPPSSSALERTVPDPKSAASTPEGWSQILPERMPPVRPSLEGVREGIEPIEPIEPRYGWSLAPLASYLGEKGEGQRPSFMVRPIEGERPIVPHLVDPISVAWLTMHARLDGLAEEHLGGAESEEAGEGANGLTLFGAPLHVTLRKSIGDEGLEKLGRRVIL
jgi:hypothetical protein